MKVVKKTKSVVVKKKKTAAVVRSKPAVKQIDNLRIEQNKVLKAIVNYLISAKEDVEFATESFDDDLCSLRGASKQFAMLAGIQVLEEVIESLDGLDKDESDLFDALEELADTQISRRIRFGI